MPGAAGQAGGTEARAGWGQTLAIALGAVLVVGLLGLAHPWQWLGWRAFDYLSTYRPPPLPDKGAIIVAIDEPSLAQFGQWPWPRSRHAELVEALRKAGAKTIVLDLVFAEASADPEADRALAAAMGPDVVLAADIARIDDEHGDLVQRDLPLQPLLDHGARYGLVGVQLDTDGVLRRVPRPPKSGEPGDEVLAKRVLEAAGMAAPATGSTGLIQYFGKARTYPTVSYYQALDPAHMLPPGLFKDRIVIVGFSQQTQADITLRRPDAFATAFTIRDGHLTFGVEVNATIIDNLRLGLSIHPAHWAWVLLVALLAALAISPALRRYDPIRATLFTLLGLALLIAAGWLGLRYGRVWVTPTTPGAALILMAVARTAVGFLQERAHRRWITDAFGRYVAPEMVAQLVADPTRLKLGGEARELTFLFCDLRGFTAISEAMQSNPEGLTHLVNRIMDALSDCVIAEGGTIDKYIGDCLMAFWNAPLETPDHALRAVRAGAAMIARIDALAASLAAEGLPRVAVGVGINTGRCVVGNMGSRNRFNYTALGDAVNLAARLESASKDLGVPIVIGPETARQVGDRLPLRGIGTITVKGKQESVEVFTLAG